ncbi:dehydrogenase [Thermanaerothrix daxensis]|uniref:Dehydrogenase n=1 Tax=Thermanaerothrix daxensis TaxID=869279 RepID=A0A0P6XVM1_9CHLR|nr:Gfo/Idh/MocA family oxidoreductase [Thermanaerothrix daxensis]KPL83195.1 dehydrogenase [Thermanaerothrix daxensis]
MSKDKPIKVGVAGVGFIGPAHIEALRRINIPVVGLVSSTPERSRQKAAALGVPKAYASYEEMIADPEITAVHLATPNYLHYQQAKAALLAGKHVICDKPLAMNSRESAELVTLAREKGLVNAVCFNLRFYPLLHHARSLIQQGALGDLFILQGSYLQDWLLYPTDWNWRLEPELGGTLRAVADIGSHWLDLLTFLTGLKVKAVFADFKTFIPVRKKPSKPVETYTGKLLTPEDYVDQPIYTEDYATILLRYENDVRGVVTVAQVCAGRKNRLYFEIDGSKAAMAFDSERPNELWLGYRDKPNEVLLKDPSLLSPEARAIASYPGGHNEGFPDIFKQLFKKVYDYVERGDYTAPADFPTFLDGHHEMLIAEAIERSAKEGRWVEVQYDL